MRDFVNRKYTPLVSARVTTPGYSFGGCILQNAQLFGKDPVDQGSSVIEVGVYNPQDPAAAKSPRTVLLLPPTGGENAIDRGYANGLCRDNIRVVIVRRWSHFDDQTLDLATYDRAALRMIVALRRVVDFIHPERPGQVGVLGTSVGAIEASFLLGYDSRVSAGVLIVGGMGMPEILANSDLEALVAMKNERMKQFGYRTLKEYEAALRNSVHFDPAEFAAAASRKRILAFVGTKDTTVPTRNQFDLVRALGATPVTVALDHVQAIVSVFSSKRGMVEEFFLRNLR